MSCGLGGVSSTTAGNQRKPASTVETNMVYSPRRPK
jgi:hypothetical protein